MRAALLLVCGCNVAFGLDHVDPPPDAPPDAATTRAIAGVVSENYLTYDAATGMPGHTNVFPQQNGATIFLADATTGLRTQVPYDFTNGTFSITAPIDQRARIQLQFGAMIYEWQWDGPTLAIAYSENQRVGEVTATAGTMVSGAAPISAAAIGVYATGIWQQYQPPISLSTWSIPWTGGLASAAKGDRVFATGLETQANGDLVVTTSTGPVALEMMIAQANPISAPFVKLVRDQCLVATTHLDADAGRATARFPELTGGSEVLVYAIPQPTMGIGVAWLLMRTPLAVLAVNETYPSIFGGFTPVVATYTYRSLAPEGVALQNGVFRFELAPACGETRELIANSVGIPAHGTLAGTALAADNSTHVALTGATTTFAWDVDGPAELYSVSWLDLGTKQYTPRQIQTRATSVVLDTTDLVPGHKYAFSVIALSGLPNLAAGDVSTIGYPHERATTFFPEVTID